MSSISRNLLTSAILLFAAVSHAQAPCEDACTTTADGDGDGLTDCVEACFGTNPTLPDTDTDGMPDAFEYEFNFQGDNPADAGGDGDNDFMSNLDEFLKSSDPRSATDPYHVFFVSPSGANAPGRGSQASPWRTIAFALNQVSPTPAIPVRLRLLPGTYSEVVSLQPNVLLDGGDDRCGLDDNEDCTIIEGRIIGAQDAAVRNLTVLSTDTPFPLLLMDNVAMNLEGVLLQGYGEGVGAYIAGDKPRSAVFHRCAFQDFDYGVELAGAIPVFRLCDFQYNSDAHVRLLETTVSNANTKGLGDADDSFLSGWNRFLGGAGRIAMINERDVTVIAESNEWDMETAEDIEPLVVGDVDFEPFRPIDDNILAATIVCILTDAETQNKITSAEIQLNPAGPGEPTLVLGRATDGVYAFPAVREGLYTIGVNANGFADKSVQVSVNQGETMAVTVPLKASSGGGGGGGSLCVPEGKSTTAQASADLLLIALVCGTMLKARQRRPCQ